MYRRALAFLFVTMMARFAWAQNAVQEFAPDLNGNMVARGTAASSDGGQAVFGKSISGQTVPLEKTESKTLRESPTEKVTEQIIQHYGPDGQLVSTERIVTDEHKRPDGGSSTDSTVQRSDLNGNMREVERRAATTKVQGKTSTSELTISRPGPDGKLAPDEKHKIVRSGNDTTAHEEEEIYKASADGQFTQSAHNVTDQTVAGGKSTSQTAHYQIDYQGRMQLDNLQVTTKAKAPDGSEVTEVNTFGYPAGQTRSDAPPQAIQSQQVIQRVARPDGTLAETLSVSLPSLSDPNRLGPANVVSQKICSGQCDATKP